MPTDLSRRIRGPRPRAAIYTRVSKDRREGRSVAQQEADCRRDVDREGWDLVDVRSDNDVSASRYSKKERPGWVTLMQEIREGRFDVLVFWEMSRGTRHRREWAELAELAEDQGLFLMVRGRVYDARDPHDMAYLDGLVTRGVEESGETRERILRNVESMAAEGRPTGWPGYGYTYVYDPDSGELAAMVPDREQAPVVAEIASRVLAGHGYRTIARDLNERQVPNSIGYVAGQTMTDGKVSKGWTAATIVSMLKRPSIMGKRSHKGRIIDAGGWDPIVEPADWWAIQKRLASGQKGAIRDGAARHLLSGVATCGATPDGQPCGARVYAQESRIGAKGRRRSMLVYKCLGRYAGAGLGHVSRKAATIEEHVLTLLFARLARPDALRAFTEGAPAAEDVRQAEADLARARTELEELYADVEAGRVSRRLAAADESRLERDIARLEEATRPVRTDPLVEEMASGDPQAVWAGWSLEQQRRFLRMATEEIRVLSVGRVGRREVSIGESVAITWRGRA